jgi:hypothetical protein
MRFRFFIVFILLITSWRLQAQVRDLGEAKSLAAGFIEHVSLQQQRVAPANSLSMLEYVELSNSVQQSPFYYVFNVANNQGYIIISGDQRARDVLAYSTNKSLLSNKIPDNLRYWLSVYENEIRLVRQADVNIGRTTPGYSTYQTVAPLLGSIKWNQGDPYNLQCPEIDSNNARAVTGCVATGMAQVMRYYQWPVQGSGQNSYSTHTLNIPLSVDFSQTTYNWNMMTPTYSNSSSEDERQAVATLMYHCGVAVNMDYNTSSGASVTEMGRALHEHFNYDENIQLADRNYYNRQDWHQLILDELYAARPVLYSGSSSDNSGHLWVCDGVDQNGYLHFNWGWGGMSDGYFALTALNPGSLGTGGGIGGYNYHQQITYGIEKPNASSQPRLSIYSGNTPEANRTAFKRTEGFNLAFKEVFNRGLWPVTVQFGVGLYNGSSFVGVLSSYQSVQLGSYFGYNLLPFNSLSISQNIPVGTYSIKPIMKALNQSNWMSIPMKVGVPGELQLRLTADSAFLSLTEPSTSLLEVVELSTNGNLYENKTGRFNVTLSNSGLEYNSSVKVKLTPVSTGGSLESSAELINIINGETKTIEFRELVSVSAGEYWMSVLMDGANNYDEPVFQSIGTPIKVIVNTEPVLPPALTLTEVIAFPDNGSVFKNQASLKTTIQNTGGVFDNELIAFIFNPDLGMSIAYLGPQQVVIDTQETATIYFTGEIALENGNYIIALYYKNELNQWKRLDPQAFSIIPFTLSDNVGTSIVTNESENLVLYPNPVSDILEIELPSLKESVSIYSTDGKRVVYTLTKGEMHFKIPVSDLIPGVYFLRAENDRGEVVQKRFIKN